MEVRLRGDIHDSWGAKIDFETWKVLEVLEDEQFDKRGVKLGSKVLRINGKPVQDEPEKFKQMLLSGEACEISIAVRFYRKTS